MRLLVGSVRGRSSRWLAEETARRLQTVPGVHNAKYGLYHDAVDRLWIRKLDHARRVDPDGLVATFTRKFDPDWLAERIEDARRRAA